MILIITNVNQKSGPVTNFRTSTSPKLDFSFFSGPVGSLLIVTRAQHNTDKECKTEKSGNSTDTFRHLTVEYNSRMTVSLVTYIRINMSTQITLWISVYII